MQLYVKLDEILRERGWSGKVLAEKSGVSENRISEIRGNQRTTINREHIAKVAKGLGLTDMNELFEIRE
ncbi:helix-turn-helix transcriptional regulator [Bacillus sonorensis]|uniref:helix-turn-helix domain-containing protein n=1 Tax=Bacillus sonorensis TaxID=119858 RepID=UPI002DB66CAC|nr:helix-turn-helix transcriptional regulator [Bacillus sonorensis]MEC1426613.1 helix-turn-helix transcriptional regulator [Bacillus sonorensis]